MIRKRYWLLAVLVAISIHVFAFVVLTENQQDGAEMPGEQGIEIDLGMMGALTETNEPEKPVEPEPVAEPEPIVDPEPEPEPTPAPEPVKQPPVVQPKQQTETKVKKTPDHAHKPDPVVRTEAEPVKPLQQTATNKPTEKISRQTQQKQPTGKAKATTNGGQVATRQSYFSLLAATLAKHKRYPLASRRRGEEGIVKLFFIVDRDGKVLDYRITESSGSQRLDDAVMRMLKKAEPLPAFPAEMTQSRLEVNVPIAFQLNSG